MTKRCELCSEKKARMYCESDKASLCWGCDVKVHTANFLVSNHTRTLLCHSCQSPTPWSGSGASLGPSVSLCHACTTTTTATPSAASCSSNSASTLDAVHDLEDEDEDDDDEDEDEDEDDDDDDDDAENQVVPPSMVVQDPGSSSDYCSSDSGREFSGYESKASFSWARLR